MEGETKKTKKENMRELKVGKNKEKIAA